ncbi:hypothetical protein GGX14DRAFT_391560 [Mycena pura]|uniref:Uncharacterized protein n=1 Tax=Mycena pura TaxID=153505 RepID=A0AAD6YEV3_9AGAR|nr:hypothetical protein GGX14DRAFT_391560 [Mycena pura]
MPPSTTSDPSPIERVAQTQSPPGTPNLDLDFSQVKDLLLQCPPRKSGQELTDLRAELAACTNNFACVLTHCKWRLVDLENEADDPRKRARRGRNHRTDGVEVASQHVFLATDLDDAYDPELRFAITNDGEEHEPHQAQLREVADSLPDDLKPSSRARAFYDGMRSQLVHTRNRIRNNAPRYILPGLKDIDAKPDPETGEREIKGTRWALLDMPIVSALEDSGSEDDI